MEEYTEEIRIKDMTEKEKEIELITNIIKARNELDTSMKNFEYAEEDLIDYYTYHIKATRAKFDYLVKEAKKMGIALDMIQQKEMKLNEAI